MDEGIKKNVHLVRDGGFFEGSWGQGFHQDVGSVLHVCGYCGLETGVCQYLHDITLHIPSKVL
jgi:hypothetical protein